MSGVKDVKDNLLRHSAVVVMEENQYFGVLTALDLVRKPHILVLDCLCYKSELEKSSSIANAIFYMKNDNTDVLPVFENKKFIGLVFKNDIHEYYLGHYLQLRNKYELDSKRLEESNFEYKRIIQQQKSDFEKLVEQRTRELIDLVETKEKFIRIMVHELRNPFNSILVFLSLLQKNLNQYEPEKIEKFLTQIYRSASSTFDLLINLSEWLNAEQKKIPYHPERILIYPLLSEEIILTSVAAEQAFLIFNPSKSKPVKRF